MMVLFVSLMAFFFKWRRIIYILISFEFIIMVLFYIFSFKLVEMMFFYFMCFTVVSSVLGLVVMVSGLKFYGMDLCVF